MASSRPCASTSLTLKILYKLLYNESGTLVKSCGDMRGREKIERGGRKKYRKKRKKKRKVYKKREEIAEKRGKQTLLDIKKASATSKIRRVFSALANTIEQRPLVRERAAVACDTRSCAVRRRAAKKKGIAL